jgi:formylglycine-generating enzyme required for sulfatase activity
MRLLCAVAALTSVLAQKPEFLPIPAGQFNFGCDQPLRCAETLPTRRVAIAEPLRMMKNEVTVRQFGDFVAATNYRTDAEKAGDAKTWRSPGFELSAKQPVVWMSLNDARAYCEWAGGRVPTEVEWTYAARAGATAWHYWGEEFDERYAWFFGNSKDKPQAVGRKRPNAWGLHDVEGNAFEWVTPSPPYTSITKAEYGSIRGGSWMTCPEPYPPEKNGLRNRMIGLSLALDYKNSNYQPTFRRYDTGIRCAADRTREGGTR